MVAIPRHLTDESRVNKRFWVDPGIVLFKAQADAVNFWHAVKTKGFSVSGGTTIDGTFYVKNDTFWQSYFNNPT